MGRGTWDTATCGVTAEQTLLAPGVVWRGAGFAFQIDWPDPGERSLKLGTPGLHDGRPVAFEAMMSVWNGYQFRVLIVNFGGGGTQFARWGVWQTLLVAVVCGEGAGFASWSCVAKPRVASLRLG